MDRSPNYVMWSLRHHEWLKMVHNMTRLAYLELECNIRPPIRVHPVCVIICDTRPSPQVTRPSSTHCLLTSGRLT